MAFEDGIVRIAASADGPAVGTGFFVTSEGYLFTCEHVVAMCGEEVWVSWTGQTFPVQAEVRENWRDESLDFALLKVELTAGSSLLALPLGGANTPGITMQTAGYPYENEGFGLFSAMSILGGAAQKGKHSYLILEQATNIKPGMSGAPAYSPDTNRVLGIVAAKNQETNTALIIPLSEIAASLQSLDDSLEPLRGILSRAMGRPSGISPAAPSGITLFYSYVAADERLQKRLETALSPLRREGLIREWHKRNIAPGHVRGQEIDSHLDTAQVILLLVSPDFLDSDEQYENDIKRAMARHQAGEARVIPILLRPCDWKTAPFGVLQELPRNGKPVSTWQDRDTAIAEIAKDIRAVVSAMASLPAAKRQEHASAPPAIPVVKTLESFEASPPPSSAASPTPSGARRSKLAELKSEQLRRHLDLLSRQYEAVMTKMRTTLDPADQIALQETANRIENEIQKTEEQLAALGE